MRSLLALAAVPLLCACCAAAAGEPQQQPDQQQAMIDGASRFMDAGLASMKNKDFSKAVQSFKKARKVVAGAPLELKNAIAVVVCLEEDRLQILLRRKLGVLPRLHQHLQQPVDVDAVGALRRREHLLSGRALDARRQSVEEHIVAHKVLDRLERLVGRNKELLRAESRRVGRAGHRRPRGEDGLQGEVIKICLGLRPR